MSTLCIVLLTLGISFTASIAMESTLTNMSKHWEENITARNNATDFFKSFGVPPPYNLSQSFLIFLNHNTSWSFIYLPSSGEKMALNIYPGENHTGDFGYYGANRSYICALQGEMGECCEQYYDPTENGTLIFCLTAIGNDTLELKYVHKESGSNFTSLYTAQTDSEDYDIDSSELFGSEEDEE